MAFEPVAKKQHVELDYPAVTMHGRSHLHINAKARRLLPRPTAIFVRVLRDKRRWRIEVCGKGDPNARRVSRQGTFSCKAMVAAWPKGKRHVRVREAEGGLEFSL